MDAGPQTHRPRATSAPSLEAFEAVVDDGGGAAADQAGRQFPRRLVVSGHPLASEAGRLAFEKGGNVVDAMIAVSFALGVVEPEARASAATVRRCST